MLVSALGEKKAVFWEPEGRSCPGHREGQGGKEGVRKSRSLSELLKWGAGGGHSQEGPVGMAGERLG